MFFWIPIPFILNLIQFVILTPNFDLNDPNWPNVRKCTINHGQLQVFILLLFLNKLKKFFKMIVEIIDVVLCYMLPCIIVVVLNLLIASKVKSSKKTFNKTEKTIASKTTFSMIEYKSDSSSKNSIIINKEVSY